MLKERLRTYLPILLTELKLADACQSTTDPQLITACAIKVIQGLTGDLKNAVLHNLSIFISKIAADGSFSWSDGVMLAEWYYQNEYKAAK